MKTAILLTALSVALSASVITPSFAQEISASQADEIAKEAYVYFYPLLSMDVTRQQMTVGQGRTPANRFHQMRAFPTAEFREVVRSNFDTLYSSGWLDLSNGPVVVSTADTAGRYYMLPMLDLWSDVFAVPGKRTTGTKAAKFAVVPPGWSGTLPAGVERIDSPTAYVWIVGRTQTNGPKDYEAVHRVQDGYGIEPLKGGAMPKHAAVKNIYQADPKAAPLDQVNSMPAATYFPYATELMKLNPPHITDQPIVARMKRLGIVAGESFDFAKASPVVRSALQAAPKAGLAAMKERYPKLTPPVNGWVFNTDTMGVYGTYYLKRAIIAMVGLGANLPEDAVYSTNVADAEGQPMTGDKKYVLHFDKKDLPPVDAFWSLTMYDEAGFQVANTLDRFAIGDRDALKFNADGSLDLFIQAESPGTDKESNWLPAPKSGALGITLRLYGPRPAALDGTWVPPAVRRVK